MPIRLAVAPARSGAGAAAASSSADAGGARVIDLTVRLLSGTDAKGGSLRQRVLHLEVSDDGDPFFLHSLTISEGEFSALATEQVRYNN